MYPLSALINHFILIIIVASLAYLYCAGIWFALSATLMTYFMLTNYNAYNDDNK